MLPWKEEVANLHSERRFQLVYATAYLHWKECELISLTESKCNIQVRLS